MSDFSFLDDFVDVSLTKKPNNIAAIHYMFWDKGISYNEFKNLPIPYIISIIRTHSWVKEQEEKEYQKAKRKK